MFVQSQRSYRMELVVWKPSNGSKKQNSSILHHLLQNATGDWRLCCWPAGSSYTAGLSGHIAHLFIHFLHHSHLHSAGDLLCPSCLLGNGRATSWISRLLIARPRKQTNNHLANGQCGRTLEHPERTDTVRENMQRNQTCNLVVRCLLVLDQRFSSWITLFWHYTNKAKYFRRYDEALQSSILKSAKQK